VADLHLLAQSVESLTWVERLGVIGLLMVILIGGARRWWVFGWSYRELSRERDLWRNIALRGTKAAEESATVAARITARTIDDDLRAEDTLRREDGP
jgi:hypothetical protein